MLNPFLKLPTNRAANPCVHSTGYVPVAEITRVSPVVLQRYHPGVGYGISLLTAAGEPLAAFQHRRVREVPPSGVMGALRVSTALDPTLYEWACQLLRAMEWTGLAMVEFKVDHLLTATQGEDDGVVVSR